MMTMLADEQKREALAIALQVEDCDNEIRIVKRPLAARLALVAATEEFAAIQAALAAAQEEVSQLQAEAEPVVVQIQPSAYREGCYDVKCSRRGRTWTLASQEPVDTGMLKEMFDVLGIPAVLEADDE
jgi:hypothetical protein